jgi:hypothetical protein
MNHYKVLLLLGGVPEAWEVFFSSFQGGVPVGGGG